MILVFIVAPVRVYRDELAHGLNRSGELRVLGSAATGEEARDRVQSLGADVVLVDTSMPAGVAAARTIRQATVAASLVALAAPEDDGSVIACAEAGVAAFVGRDASLDELVVTTRAVARGELPAHSPRIAAALLRRVADGARPPAHAVLAPLTLARATDRRAHRRGALQQGDRRTTVHRAQHGEEPRPQPAREARSARAGGGRGARACRVELGRLSSGGRPAHFARGARRRQTSRR